MKPIYYILLGFVLGILLFYWGSIYFEKPIPVIDHQKETIIKDSIIYQEKEVIKWKKAKSEIRYITEFDTLATIDTVLVELIKCDSAVKIDSNIIAGQDTIIVKQKELIALSEAEKEALKKEIKRQKRKTLFTKVVAGVVIVVTILLLK
jgi:predicted nucleic acid-binding Zn ribbon protein